LHISFATKPSILAFTFLSLLLVTPAPVTPVGLIPAVSPATNVKLYNVTAGYNVIPGLPYERAQGLLAEPDLKTRQAFSGQATWYEPGLGV
ncbi:hypothetical protein FRC11_003363, partial [Ceratobasidium sp. 423]